MKYQSFFYSLALAAVVLSIPHGTARADANPAVSSFVVSPTTISHGQPVNITWNLTNASGHSLFLSCPAGVTVRYTDGRNFFCNLKTSISNLPSDATTFLISNNSGSTRTIDISIIPKNPVGADYSAGTQTLSLSVAPNPQPIASFTTATSTPSAIITTPSWTTTSDVAGTNLIIGCTTSDITVTAPSISTGTLPCGVVISQNTLSANGSLGLIFTNKSTAEVAVLLSIIPAIVSGSYDATHGAQSSIIVQPAKVVVPTIISFTASPIKILSGKTSLLSWVTKDTSGVNLKFGCNENVSVAKIESGATTTVACSTYLFNSPLTTTSATVMLTNLSYTDQTITAGLVPASSNNTYNGMMENDITLGVFGAGVTTTPVTTLPAITVPVISQASPAVTVLPTPLPPTSTAPSPATSSATKNKPVFNNNLSRGLINGDVTTLQQFFADNPAVYGKVTVNGVFGPATEKLVVKFQEKNDIEATGTVGPKTREALNSAQNKTTSPQSAATTTATAETAGTGIAVFARGLNIGSRGNDVTALQNRLIKERLLGGGATGYFGFLTSEAVKKFQEKYGITQKGNPGYGTVGPATRKKLNELQ